MSYEIKLEGLSFKAFHGVYDFEQKEGNTFLVDVGVRFSIDRLPVSDDILTVPDYQVINTVVCEEMNVPKYLLETVARSISVRLWNTFPEAKRVKISIRKTNPPLGNTCSASCVVLETEMPL